MKVLVAGGFGYIGSVLVPCLQRGGYSVDMLDADFFRSAFGISGDTWKIDVREIGRWPSLLDGVDVVVNLASLPNDPTCDLRPELSAAINKDAAVMLAIMAKWRGVKKYIFASSCAVYGSSPSIVDEFSNHFKPQSLYAKLKLETEIALKQVLKGQVCFTAMRFGTVYGPSSRMRFDLVVNMMVDSAIRTGVVHCQGGGQSRPFIYIDDVAEAIESVIRATPEQMAEFSKEERSLRTYNFTNENVTIVELAEMVASLLDASVEMKTMVADRRDYAARSDLAMKLFGWRPSTDLKTGIILTRNAIVNGHTWPSTDPRTHTVEWYAELLKKEILQ